MGTYNEIQEIIQREGIAFVDLKALDLTGRLHHLSLPVEQFGDIVLKDGIGFDGSSYGFAKTENSDMVLIPEPATAFIDPFREAPTLSMICKIHLADEERSRFPQDVRYVAEKAEQLLKELQIADSSRWAPEYEFNIFEEVDFRVTPEESLFAIYSGEYSHGNAYHACNPRDRYADFRDRVVELLQSLGIQTRYHHHEVGAYGQQEIEATFAGLVETADQDVYIRYILRNQAAAEGLVITLMPKPIHQQAGNGWHVHQYLERNGVNIFYQPGEYGNLSKPAQYYIGGILSHGPALCAFTNPSTNSYKRLVPGFEAPTVLTFGKANRSGALRIPAYVNDPALVRVEYRPPDATSNPYLCLAAMLAAGIDGIINKIDPVAAGFGPCDRMPDGDSDYKVLPYNISTALDALEKDNEFLTRGDVFPAALIERWINIKREEYREYSTRPHPYEFELYFDF